MSLTHTIIKIHKLVQLLKVVLIFLDTATSKYVDKLIRLSLGWPDDLLRAGHCPLSFVKFSLYYSGITDISQINTSKYISYYLWKFFIFQRTKHA